MSPSADERREVAARLRHASQDAHWTTARLDVTIAIAILETVGEVHRPIAAVVADLTDHTCDTGWEEPPAYCDMCGARVVDKDDD